MLRTRNITTLSVAALALTGPATAGAAFSPGPDARERIVAAQAARGDAAPYSPDAVDNRAAARAGRTAAPTAAPTRASVTQSVDRSSDGFGWSDAGIGAAGTLGVVLALGGITALSTSQRGPLLRH